MDFKKILAKIDLFEGAGSSMKKAEHNPAGPEFKGYWKGSNPNPPKPGEGVGGCEESILKDLSKGPKPKTKEQELAEAFDEFLETLEEDNLGVEEKRPQRKGSRPAREYTSLDKPSKRYNYKKAVDEGTEMISKFRQELEALQASDKSPAEKHAIYTYLVDKFGKEAQEYKEKTSSVDEDLQPMANPQAGGMPQQGQPAQSGAPAQGQAAVDPKQVQDMTQATQAIKSATGSTAPAPNLSKALDAAAQGKAVGQQDMKNLQPLMKDMTTVAQNPQLANQFKTLAQQTQQVQRKQQQQTKTTPQ